MNGSPYNKKIILSLVPALTLVIGLVGYSIGSTLTQAYQSFESIGASVDASIYITSFFYTLRIAVLATLSALALALFLLYLVFTVMAASTSRRKVKQADFLLAPMFFPYFSAAYMIYLTFSQTGLLSRVTANLGLTQAIQDFPILVNDPFGWGILITYVWKTAPFMLLLFIPTVLQHDWKNYEMARVFGCKRPTYFLQVILPSIGKTALFVSLIVFTFTFTSFEVPYLLGVTYPKTLSVLTYEFYVGGNDMERALAFLINGLVLLGTSGLGIYVFGQMEGLSPGKRQERRRS